MDFHAMASALNGKVRNAYPDWPDLLIWDADREKGEPSIVHLIYSAVFAVTGDAECEWVAVDVDEPFDREKTSVRLTVWTADLVLHAVREPGLMRPTVQIAKRSTLSAMEVLEAPLLTTSDWHFHNPAVSVRLTYPSFSAVLRDARGEDLLSALPTFAKELDARAS